MPERANVLEVDLLRARLRTGRESRQVLKGVSFAVPRGSVFALVGASGCGKTVTVNAVLGLLDRAHARLEGRIRFWGQNGNVLELLGPKVNGDGGAFPRQALARSVAVTFQDAGAYLNPYWTVGAQFKSLARLPGMKEAMPDPRAVALKWLRWVDIGDHHTADVDRTTPGRWAALRRASRHPEGAMGRFPHQLSGGEAARITLALGMALEPELLIADEPTAGLDPRRRNEVGELMLKAKRDRPDLSILLISHDIGFISRMADHVAVMREGIVVERIRRLPSKGWEAFRHPYARKLLRCQEEDLARAGRCIHWQEGSTLPICPMGWKKSLANTGDDCLRRALHPGSLAEMEQTDHWVACQHAESGATPEGRAPQADASEKLGERA